MNTLKKINWFLDSQVGINLIKLFRSPYGLLRYTFDLIKIRSKTKQRIALMPCINDWYEGAGSVFTEYFWQDLIYAKLILDRCPVEHVDIGSRIDGFVAHLAAKIQVNVLDVRPLNLDIPNICFTQADILNDSNQYKLVSNSVSCLHTVEHFGLGRYGDIIDPDGLFKGLGVLLSMVKPGGFFYLSSPLGKEIIQFNANRVTCPKKFFEFVVANGFNIERFYYFFNDGYLEKIGPPKPDDINYILQREYCLVGLVLQKT
jgi:hypothetical protein